ncbi:hypothetical protein DES41_106354 [Pseudorhodoferax soli]|uniref:Uncharacterized protein n=1 Tax=Pseudorhodoferax soli TaxID=545864 RepID=A0A368XNC3_9BURK|nr:hypothetical protein DES41_106354 [Pseudorhodoferax soli]
MTLFKHSIHTGRYRIARQPRLYRGRRAAAWTKLEVAFSVPEPALSFWELADALEKGEWSPAEHPHTFLRYCIRQGWLERV